LVIPVQNNLLPVQRICGFVSAVTLSFRRFDLKLAHRWAIARSVRPAGSGGTHLSRVVFIELKDSDGTMGIGEAAPASRYDESADSALAFLERVDPDRISFADAPGSMKYLDSIGPKHMAAKAALNIALLDGAARRAGKPVYDFLSLGFTENRHVTSVSIGIDTPETIRLKVRDAAQYSVLKLKVGSATDRENLTALREVAPTKPVRVDANEGWRTKEEALRQIEWLAADGHVQFVEQPLPSTADPKDLVWLKERSPLPIMADESYLTAGDIDRCAGCYHAVNVKLMKTGGITGAVEALQAARGAGLKTMLGCMIESSVSITAAAHLAELADYLDIDGNLLVTNDPYLGASANGGIISFAGAAEATGLRVKQRSLHGLSTIVDTAA
jgi:L-alanine-DL-glutamate epimerase-like enolase superfamily enzyme